VKKQRLPSYPIFVLTAAQQGALPATTAISLGSLSKLFHALMMLALAELDIERFSDIDWYLSAMAFHMARQQRIALDEGAISEFHEWVEEVFGFSPRSAWLRKLEASKILTTSSHGTFFTFEYARNFYMAKFVNSQVRESREVSDLVWQLVERYLEELGNPSADAALMFIYSASKEDELLARLLERVEKFTGDWELVDLERDTEPINKSAPAPDSEMLLPDMEPETARLHMLEDEDERDASAARDECDSPEADQDEPNMVNEELNRAFSSLGVLGQCLKSFSTELPHIKKVQLMEVSFSVALRMIWKALTTFSDILERMINDADMIEELRARFKVDTPREVEERCRQTAFGVALYFVYLLVKGTSSSLGAQALRRQVEDAAKSMPGNSSSLLLVALGLDHFKPIPEDEASELAGLLSNKWRPGRAFRGNAFAYTILRLLAYEHLLLHGSESSSLASRNRLKSIFHIKTMPLPVLDEVAEG